MKTSPPKRILILPLLCLFLLGSEGGSALAQFSAPADNQYSSTDASANSSADSVKPGTVNTSSTFKLFAGVSHQQELPQAHEVLKPHIDRRNTSVSVSPVQIPSKPALSAPPVQAVQQTQPLVIAGQVAQKAPVLPAVSTPKLAAQSAFTQPYMPAFGVARLTAENNTAPPQPAHHYTIQWFMIPPWMAGVWQKDGDMTTNVTDLRSGRSSNQNEWTENRLQATWGHQQDAQGNYWHVNMLPSERDGVSAGKAVRFVTVQQACESSTMAQLLTRTHYIVSESSAWNNQPLDTFQQESLNHYALSPQKQLINSSSNRVFTYQGQAVREGHLVSQFVKVAPFKAVASMNGIDLRASLNDYLQNHSPGNLRK